MNELARLLRELRGPGGEPGRFTLDPARARELLSRKLFPDPHAYILKLVQWSVAGGAQHISITTGQDWLELSQDGRPVPGPRALEIFPVPSTLSLADDSLFHLALAFLGALGLEPGRIEFQSEGYRLGFSPAEGRLHQEPAGPGTRVRISGVPRKRRPGTGNLVRRSMRFYYRFELDVPWGYVSDVFSLLRPEHAIVRIGCQYCAVPLELNGKSVNRPYFGFAHRGKRLPGGRVDLITSKTNFTASRLYFFVAEDHDSRILLAPADLPGYKTWTQLASGLLGSPVTWTQRTQPRPSPLFLVNGGQAFSSHALVARVHAATAITWVRDGVIVDEQDSPSHFPRDLRIVASAAELATDISQFQLRRDERYQTAVTNLLQWVDPGNG